MGSTYFLLTYNSESNDTYRFLLDYNMNNTEIRNFLMDRLPWEIEDGSLYGEYSLENIELETKEENEGSQEADERPAGCGPL